MRRRSFHYLPAFATVSVTFLSLLIILLSPLRASADIAFFVETGRRILAGDAPFVDFFNYNLLTINYLPVIPFAIAEWLDINAMTAWLILSWIAMAISLYYSYRLSRLAFNDEQSSWLRWLFPFCLAVFSWFTLLINDFGQREHLFFLAVVPWLLLRFYCCEGGWGGFRRETTFLFGLLVGIAATMKPQFLLGLVVTELYWVFRYRSTRHFFTIETFGVVSAFFGYAVFLLLQPEILNGMLYSVVWKFRYYPSSALSNNAFLAYPHFQLPLLLGVLSFGISIVENGRLSRLLGAVAALTIIGAIMMLTQSASTLYRYFVLTGGALICGGFLLVVPSVTLPSGKSYLHFGRLAFFGYVFLLVVYNSTVSWEDLITHKLWTPKDMREIVESITVRGDDVLFLTDQFGLKLPWLRMIDRNDATSYTISWKLPKNMESEVAQTDLRYLAELTRRDIELSPSAIVIDKQRTKADILDFLEMFGLLELIQSRYRLAGLTERYDVYEFVMPSPEQGTSFELGEEFTLYSWHIDSGDNAIQACGSMRLVTWWRLHSSEAAKSYTLHVDVVRLSDGIPVMEDSGKLGNMSDYAGLTSAIDVRELTLPCELEAGRYGLLLSLEDMSVDGGDVLPVQDINGADYGKYVFLQEMEIGS